MSKMEEFPAAMRPAIDRANERIVAAMGTTREEVKANGGVAESGGQDVLGFVRGILGDKIAGIPNGDMALVLLAGEQAVNLHEQVHQGVSCDTHTGNVAAAIAGAVLYGWELAEEMRG